MCSPVVHARVVQVPQFGALVLRVPLAELVAEREDALLGARLFLVAPGAADAGVEAELGDGVEQRHRLVRRCGFRRRASARRGRARSNPRPSARSGARPARPRAGRGTRSLRESCARCRCAAAGTGSGRGGTPSRPGAAARASPCRRRTAAPGCAHWPATSRRMWIASDSSQSSGGIGRRQRVERVGVVGCDCAGQRLMTSSASCGRSRRRRTAHRPPVQSAFLVLGALPPPAAGADVLAGPTARVQGAQPMLG